MHLTRRYLFVTTLKKVKCIPICMIVAFLLCQITSAQKRYQEILFSKIDATINIPYGSAINITGQNEILHLDIFKPPLEDKVRYRPLVIFMHGDDFVSKTTSTDFSNLLCTAFAKRGYVSATIDYRLGIELPKCNRTYFEAMYRAQQDTKAAIRFFKKNAEEFGIDATQIYVVGVSSGAITALAVAYMNNEEIPKEIDTKKWGDLDGNSGNAGVSSSVQGVINCWGALPNRHWIQKGDVPLLNIDGTANQTLLNDSVIEEYGFKEGPEILHEYCTQIKISSSYKTFLKDEHGLSNNIIRADSCIQLMIDWLYQQIFANNNKPQQALFKNLQSVKIFEPKVILSTMEKVANWQIGQWDTKGYKYPKWHWANAAGYTGFTELAAISKDTLYHSRLIKICSDINWNTGPNRFFADDYCIAQTFVSLYMQKHDASMIAKFRLQADSILAQAHTESLYWKDSINYREWAWCDALFMGPGSLAFLTTATNEKKYLDLAIKLWHKTHAYLYDSSEHLYFRDQRYFTQKEKNGAKVFWSRGNGWVLAGLVRLLDNIPNNNTDKAEFIKIYLQMAAKIASIQQSDGSWHTSLLDPNTYSKPEISGTGFYTYALLWGLNKGILDKKIYWPVVVKSWKMMVSHIGENGKIGYIQPIGSSPETIDENSSEIYGIGAFLLAGSQMYTYMSKK